MIVTRNFTIKICVIYNINLIFIYLDLSCQHMDNTPWLQIQFLVFSVQLPIAQKPKKQPLTIVIFIKINFRGLNISLIKTTRIIKGTKQIILTWSQSEAQVIKYVSLWHFKSFTNLGGISGILSLISVLVTFMQKPSILPRSMRICK